MEIGTRIDDYRILSLLGRGGMGEVYEAEDTHLGRRVALKRIHAGLQNEQALKRFEYEAQILGHLKHPGIAQIYATGTASTPEGLQPWFAMELVDGVPLDEYVRTNDPSIVERVKLVVKVCEAVHHAHLKGVIHRDLKPANILVNQQGQPVVLDFGVARVGDTDLMSVSLATETGQLLGTVPYMSPEQVASDPLEIDARSDVYALGVVLYEVLSGRLPYGVREVQVWEALRVICEVDPTPLSSLHRTLRGDLDVIVGKALEKDRERRYDSAAELADDLQRYLSNEPIVARRPTYGYQLRKFAHRNKMLVGGVAAVFLTMAAGLYFSVREARRANRSEAENYGLFLAEKSAREDAVAAQRDAEEARIAAQKSERQAQQSEILAQQELLEAQAVRDFMRRVLVEAIPRSVDDVDITVREATLRAARDLDDGVVDMPPKVEASVRTAVGPVLEALGDKDEGRRHLERARELYAETTGTRTRDYLLVLRELGSVAANSSRPDAAIAYLEEARVLCEELGGEPSTLLEIQIGLSRAYQLADRLDEARVWADSFAALAAEIYADDPARHGDALSSYAFFLDYGAYAEGCEEVYRNALALLIDAYGPFHKDVASVQKNLGSWLVREYRAAEALPLLEACVETRRRLLGEQHPEFANALSNLAHAQAGLGDAQQAEDNARLALAIYLERFGDHSDTANAHSVLGDLLSEQGRVEEAVEQYELMLDMRIRLWGDESAAVADAWSRIGDAYFGSERLTEAEPAMRRALEMRIAVMGPDHPLVLRDRYDLGLCRWHAGRLDDALAEIAVAAAGFRSLHPASSGPVSIATTRELVLLLALGQAAEAEARALEVGEQDRAERQQDEMIGSYRMFLALARIYRGLDQDFADGRAYWERFDASPGQVHQFKGTVARLVAEAYHRQGNVAERDAVMTRAREHWPGIDQAWAADW